MYIIPIAAGVCWALDNEKSIPWFLAPLPSCSLYFRCLASRLQLRDVCSYYGSVSLLLFLQGFSLIFLKNPLLRRTDVERFLVLSIWGDLKSCVRTSATRASKAYHCLQSFKEEFYDVLPWKVHPIRVETQYHSNPRKRIDTEVHFLDCSFCSWRGHKINS